MSAWHFPNARVKLLRSAEQQLAFLVGARIAQFLDDLRRAVVQPIEVVPFLLCHAPPSEAVDATDSSVQIPATTISNLVSFFMGDVGYNDGSHTNYALFCSVYYKIAKETTTNLTNAEEY
jgi:hypothetical protein